METSLMSESVVNADSVEESVNQVLTHFVQGGDEEDVMSVQLLADQVEIEFWTFLNVSPVCIYICLC